jgi:UPF0755 protein
MENNPLPRHYLNRKVTFILLFVVVITVLFFNTLSPRGFKPGTIVLIERGESIKSVSKDLKNKNIIKSSTFFNLYIQLSRKSTIASGEYLFEKPSSVFSVAKRIKNADYGLPTSLVTLTEGMTNQEMAEVLSTKFPKISKDEFTQRANSLEGYLFPDTYKFNSNVTVDEVLMTLQENFENKIQSAGDSIKNSKYSLEQIIIMASIVEAESTADGRTEVASILWKRFEMNMPLQVDAPFVYSIGKGTADLTIDDLKSDSLYNTYTRTGLTPTAIGNPGLESIIAAANPKPTQNLYFLTGRDGKMYYAKSFEGHKQNRALYLD